METTRLLTVLVDRQRLAIAGALAIEPRTSDALVALTGFEPREVLTAIGDLRASGLVRVGADGCYVLDDEALRRAAQEAADIAVPMDATIGFGMSDDEQLILGRFFSGRVLNEIPTQRAKRLVILQRLALEFDVGRRYVESEINEILGAFHPDWSTLRRGMIDEGFLDREPTPGGNQYWRSGGRVTDLP